MIQIDTDTGEATIVGDTGFPITGLTTVSTLPANKDECKKGGWRTFVNVLTEAQIFKNQGDCVSFVASRGTNPPAHR